MERKQLFPFLEKGLTTSDLSLLSDVIAVYGYKFSASYRKIGEKTNMTYENVRYHFKKLEKVGLISIEHSSTRKLICNINEDKVNDLF